MAFSKKISQSIRSKKRGLDVDNCGLDEFKKPKMVVQKYPPPKGRIGVQFFRGFPPGCGIIHDESRDIERKPLKKSDKFGSNIRNMPSHAKDKMENSQPIERKRLDSSKPKELERHRSYFGAKTSGTKYWDCREQVARDFPPGITKERNPFKNVDNINSKLVDSHSFENSKLKSSKPKESGFYIPTFATRAIGNSCLKDNDAINVQNAKDTIAFESRRRETNRNAMISFDKVHTRLVLENGSKQMGKKTLVGTLSRKAATFVKEELNWITPAKALGNIPGVQPGDKFKFRPQLQMLGLHCHLYCGIDYTKINGKNIAVSIVDSHRYPNESGACDKLTYCGEGGFGKVMFKSSKGPVAPDDQKLERGNLALKNSMNEKRPVRFIRKVLGAGRHNYMYVYDGLYMVEDYKQDRGPEGNMVFVFQLHRIPGQPYLQKRVNAILGDVSLNVYHTFQMP